VVVGKTVSTEFALFEPAADRQPPRRRPGPRVARRAGPRRRSGRAPCRSPSAPRPPARSCGRHPSAASSARSRPSGSCRPTGSGPAHRRSTPSASWPPTSPRQPRRRSGVLADDPAVFTGGRARRAAEGRLLPDAAGGTQLEPGTPIRVISCRRTAGTRTSTSSRWPCRPHFDGLVDAQQAIMGTETLRALSDRARTDGEERLSDQVARLPRRLPRRSSTTTQDALALAARCAQALPDVFVGVDVLLAPSVLGEAPPLDTTGDPCDGSGSASTPAGPSPTSSPSTRRPGRSSPPRRPRRRPTRRTGSSPGRQGARLVGRTARTSPRQPRHDRRDQRAARGRHRAAMGLITTEGYRYVLEIARQSVPDGYGNSYFWVKPDRIVPVDLVREVGGTPRRAPGRGPPFDEEEPIARSRALVPRARHRHDRGVLAAQLRQRRARARHARGARARAPRRRRVAVRARCCVSTASTSAPSPRWSTRPSSPRSPLHPRDRRPARAYTPGDDHRRRGGRDTAIPTEDARSTIRSTS
jgi:hypothetical protein